VVFNNNRCGFPDEPAIEGDIQKVAIGFEVVWRIEEDNVRPKTFTGESAKSPERILPDNAVSAAYAAKVGVAPDEAASALGVLNKNSLTRPAA